MVIGFHTFGGVHPEFAISLAKATRYCGTFVSHVFHVPSPYVSEARNLLVKHMLDEAPQCEWLLMVDADIEFNPQAVMKTWAVAISTGAEIVWGNYALGDFRNSIFMPPLEKESELPLNMWDNDLAANMIIEGIYTGGTGWVLISRTAAEKIRKANPDDPWPWFNHDIGVYAPSDTKGRENARLKDINDRIRMGEDISFGIRANKAGCKQVGYTGLCLMHHKDKRTMPAFMQGFAEANKMQGHGIIFGVSHLAKPKEGENEPTENPDNPDGHPDGGTEGGAVEQEELPPNEGEAS